MNKASHRSSNVVLAVMPKSPFNSSIWHGLAHGFKSLGHNVMVVDASRCPVPAQIKEDVDLFFAVHGFGIPEAIISEYKKSHVMTGVYLLDEPYEIDRTVQWARHYDHVFSVDRVTVPVHSAYTNASFLPLAYSDAIFSPKGDRVESDILVLGSPYKAREPYLAALRAEFGSRVTWVGPGWKSFSPQGVHHDMYVSPMDCARFYRGAELVINIHRDSTWSHFGDLNQSGLKATHLNPRFWEGVACGSLQLTSYREDLTQFAPDAPSFDSVDGFLELVGGYLSDDQLRRERALVTSTDIQEHTYVRRAAQVMQTVF